MAVALILSIIFVTDNGELFGFPFYGPALQAENHVGGTFKIAFVFFPDYTTFAMLQADKLLLHFPAAAGAEFIAGSHKNSPF